MTKLSSWKSSLCVHWPCHVLHVSIFYFKVFFGEKIMHLGWIPQQYAMNVNIYDIGIIFCLYIMFCVLLNSAIQVKWGKWATMSPFQHLRSEEQGWEMDNYQLIMTNPWTLWGILVSLAAPSFTYKICESTANILQVLLIEQFVWNI